MKNKMIEMDDDVENTGIMQGFMDSMADEGDDEGDDEDDPKAMMDRRPDTPEILMNNLRGDMRSVDARRDELADLVGYQAARETPDQVLAMLQPVLAQQGGGGIGALPQSAPMAQGPQPPMMGGAPGMPPPGMPPLPPDAGMPPPPQQGGIAELMAGLGGGAGAPPMPPGGGMPASDQPPVAMARGGYVQNFQVGSNEEGVTPADDSESSSVPPAGTYPRDLVERARANMTAMLAQKPMAVPDLAKTSEERAQLYKQILGDSGDARQAQMLMALGQRAFNFGANTDDQGRPLRGGFGARLAGAARTLPGEMAGFIAQTDKEQRQLKLLGLQAAEKEVEAAKANNIKVMETQRKFYADILKSEGKGKSPFGTGREAGALEMFVKLSPDFAAGKTSEEQDRYFLTAVSDYTRPTLIEVKDPDRGTISYRTQQNPLPDFVKSALKARKMGVPTAAAPGTAAPGGGGAPAATVTPVPAPGTAAAAPGATAAPAPAPEPRTIWNQSSFIAGPVPSIQGAVARIPGFGGIAPEVQQARTFVDGAVRELVKNLQSSPVFAQREREAIEGEVDIGPRFFDDPEGLRNRMIGVDDFLATKVREAQAFAQTQDSTSKARGQAMDTVQAITNFRKILGVPVRVYSVEEVQRLQPGTPFLWNGTQPRVRQ